MRIDLNLSNTTSVEGGRTPKQSTATRDFANSSAPQDAAQLSPEIQRVSALESHLSNLPEVRSERVAELQNAIHRGHYHASSEHIASAMLADRLTARKA